MIEVTYDGKPLAVKELTYTIDKTTIDDGVDLANAIVAEQSLTLDVEFYKGMMLVQMLRKHSPKKAKRLQRMLVNTNPLKKLGLL